MSKTPTKSQPLHNFSLPQLKWAQSNNRLRRRSSYEPHNFNSYENTVPESSNHAFQKPSSLEQQGDLENSKGDDDDGGEDSNYDEFRHRKLRQRKAVSIPLKSGENENLLEETAARQKMDGDYVASRLRGSMSVISGQGQNHGSERQRKMTEEKSRIWVSLSREEIEEDVYAFTGSRPARRPKSRAKIVQRQLDHVFPGLYLVGMSVDYYRLLLSKATRAELQAINF